RQRSSQPVKPTPAKPPAGLLDRLAAAAHAAAAQQRREAVAQKLTQAERHQKSVEDGLNGLLELLSEWGGRPEVRGEARVIREGGPVRGRPAGGARRRPQEPGRDRPRAGPEAAGGERAASRPRRRPGRAEQEDRGRGEDRRPGGAGGRAEEAGRGADEARGAG